MISNKNLVAYVNGKYVLLEKASISILDLGFTNSEMIYDTFRTFNKVPYFVDEHLERLKYSSQYAGIKINISIPKIKKIINLLLKKNLKFLKKDEDLWCFLRFTRSGSAVIEMRKINFSNYAPFYKNGLRLHVPKLKRIPPEYLDPRFKNSSSYFTLSLAREEIWKFDRKANAILLDKNNNINEGYGFNIFFIKNKTLYTPKSKYVLPGITRKKVIEMSKKLKMKTLEKNISLKEVKLFDECFVTATGWGICSVKSLNKKKFKEQKYTKQIQQSFSKHVELNIINQYLSFLK
ncbi:aminotransferase class IV [Candidatus Pelagibacter ubique]|jgi:branched-chain amino acid aminotransferase|nr:aminotransferase class IV [Candidatus Pelagibacter ubique]